MMTALEKKNEIRELGAVRCDKLKAYSNTGNGKAEFTRENTFFNEAILHNKEILFCSSDKMEGGVFQLKLIKRLEFLFPA
jgi:hypothetical protein